MKTPRRGLAAAVFSFAITASAQVRAPGELVVRRADVGDRVLLTGELEAVAAEDLVVPRTSEWFIQLRWLEVDGTFVKAGQRVAEFDNSAFAADLNEKKLAAIQAADDLDKQRAQNGIDTADKAFEVEKSKAALETARIDATVDKDTLPARVWQENQLALERAQTAYAKAVDDLEAQKKGAALDVEVKQIALEKSQREIHAAEDAIDKLVLRAPRDGVVVIGNHPREGRKLEVGDTIWVGLPVVRLPDLSTMRVKAALSDVDDGRVEVGMKATCTLDAYPDHPFEGVVTALSPVAREPSQKSQRRAFQVNVSLPQLDRGGLLPGLSVKVEIPGRVVQGALVAPRAALDFELAPPKLRTVDGGSLEVDVGLCSTQECEVRSRSDGAKAALQPGLRLRAVGSGD
jgi:multidrug efflux pump subunit AcrA (membrane-fusion protein)